MSKTIFKIEKSGVRLDVFLTENTNFSRSFIKSLNDQGFILVNGKAEKAGIKLKIGDIVEVEEKQVEVIDTAPENIPLNIVYEDEDLLVINKQVGLVVHPCTTTKNHTLVNALMYHVDKLSTINGRVRLQLQVLHLQSKQPHFLPSRFQDYPLSS